MNRLTMLLAAAAAAGAVALTTGCGSTTSTVTVPPAQNTSSSPANAATTPAATGGGSTTGTATVAKCATRDLKATLGRAEGAAGSVYIALQFTNIGSADCTLFGYPGVSLAGGSPVKQISPGADRSNTVAVTLVKLSPGAMATATLQVAQAENYPASTCVPKPSTFLQIFPPDQTTPMYVAYSSTACTKPVHQLWITAMKAGSAR